MCRVASLSVNTTSGSFHGDRSRVRSATVHVQCRLKACVDGPTWSHPTRLTSRSQVLSTANLSFPAACVNNPRPDFPGSCSSQNLGGPLDAISHGSEGRSPDSSISAPSDCLGRASRSGRVAAVIELLSDKVVSV